MHLRSVELINWRSYRHARFDFPTPHGHRNVILIRAPNEYGKTSFFEALTLGLFGRDGLVLVPRARAAVHGDAVDRFKASYSQFLSNTLHHRATETGPAKCSVSIEVEDDSGEPIELTRIWHFRQNRQHKPSDDDLTIFHGLAREPVIPPSGIENRDEWFRDWIAQRFLHPSLAEFFLFDGEQVQRYANREMGEQVRRGIEGLLGLPILRNLKSSLATYAQQRRTSAAAPTDSTVKKVEADIAAISEAIVREQDRFNEAATVLPGLTSEIDELTQAIGGRGEGTTAMVGKLMQSEQRHRDEAQRAMDALLALIQEDVALAVAGPELRDRTRKRLEAEAKLERWEAGRNEGAQNLDRFALELGRRVSALDPPLDEDRRLAVVEAGKAAWDALWHPAPEGCPDNYRHPSLNGTMRDRAIERLLSLDNHTEGEVAGQEERFRIAVERAESVKREWQELESTAPEVERLTMRLRELSEQMGRYKSQRDEADRAIQGKEAELAQKRAELGRYMSRQGASAPALRRADYADRYADLIQDLLRDALPSEVGEVAEEMTRAWKAMAHLSDRVDRIEITADCEVKMLTAQGEDLHGIDKSAGASQVFTQALITAITSVSGRTFPFVVDTPLARLSRAQRIGVLNTFTDRSGQVILLSTDEEVVDDKLDAIRERLVAAFELRVRSDKGIAVTSVHKLDPEQI
ncbi:MAG: AAA family ATPase [Boseongicola sp. SB0677_bin_26]|nr:AAA family ATPase [Boseongicola sp. SB0677_bin_26]